MKRILITGAAGFLGSHLCDRFLAEGNFVFRFTLSGSWDTADEDEIREMMSSLTLTDDAPMPAEKTGLAPFEIDFQDWLRVGAMYSRMASS